jgi:diguanylate cyclase
MAAESMETGAPLCVAMVDIDHFKKFNDTHGHQFGDKVIKLVARQLSDQSRAEDFAARYGGEEFALIMKNISGGDAFKILDRIRQSIGNKALKKRETGEIIGSIMVSCGVSTFNMGESLEGFVERADSALYKAKQSGRNRVILAE